MNKSNQDPKKQGLFCYGIIILMDGPVIRVDKRNYTEDQRQLLEDAYFMSMDDYKIISAIILKMPRRSPERRAMVKLRRVLNDTITKTERFVKWQ